MKTRRFLDSRFGYLLLSAFTLFGIILPSAMPLTVSADTITARSMQLSSTKKSDTGVSYILKFTPVVSATAVIVDFCKDSPIIADSTCTAVTGLSTAGVTSSPSGATAINTNTGVKLITQTFTAGTPATVTFSGITNPSYTTDSGNGFYARVYTYASDANATGHTSNTVVGTYADAGGIAMNITDPLTVSAAVRETLTFCISAAAPGPGCGTGGQVVTTPSIALGHGSPKALDYTATDTDVIYSQVSSNAASGVSVNMKMDSTNTCGGLKRPAPVATCDIAAVGGTAAAIAAGSAKFGMYGGTVASATGGTPNPSGTLVSVAPYNGGTTNYGMDAGGSGVTSTYGDEIFNSSSAPVSDKNIPLTFGASAGISTPAGNYSAKFYMIATGTF